MRRGQEAARRFHEEPERSSDFLCLPDLEDFLFCLRKKKKKKKKKINPLQRKLIFNLMMSGNNGSKTFTRLRQANMICSGPLEIYPGPFRRNRYY